MARESREKQRASESTPRRGAKQGAAAEETTKDNTSYSAADAQDAATEQTNADDVFGAFRQGQQDAMDAAERTIPIVKKSLAKGTYMTCYYLAFGVVYTSELVMGLVPEDSVIRHGLKDGARAAREAYAQRQEPKAAYTPAQPADA